MAVAGIARARIAEPDQEAHGLRRLTSSPRLQRRGGCRRRPERRGRRRGSAARSGGRGGGSRRSGFGRSLHFFRIT